MNLFHYCSNATLVSILEKKEIWAAQLALSNDAMEGKWIREVFIRYCKDKQVSDSDQNRLLEHLDFVISMAGYAGFCMSEEGDLLSQWRAYADNGAGASIGFGHQYFEELGNTKRDRNDEFSAHLTKVEYDLENQKKLIAEHSDEILKLVEDGALRTPTLLDSQEDTQKWQQNFRQMGLRFMFFFFFLFELKNPAFAEEREWRIISHIIHTKRDATLAQLAKMEFKPLKDRIVPFVKIPLEPLSTPSVKEIILGPRNATPERIVEAILLKYGWSDVTVRKSKASYR
jgi:Protein of unknown function (DUF2971)